MTEGRRVTRREPVTTTVELDSGTHEFHAKPLPWRKRIDFGDAINSMYTTALNEELQVVKDEGGVPVSLQGRLFEASLDYDGLFVIAYSTYKVDDEGEVVLDHEPSAPDKRAWRQLDYDGMLEVIGAALTVNGLERLSHLLDPERKALPLTGASESATEEKTDAGEKMESATDSTLHLVAGQSET